ncbi:YggS family pyridoxal phosphate-dependent enzyme [Sporosarcina saromensis]|uniref:Pyridoxal phosphate homeostasis protein n=1 Tax=Sporosarcina saromensis TaxID=359365 RepID=A0ABU4G4F8_9BACL|nr:YggS family pyridoxal phosphate-dependent enzyme [Sporosarcina saromensis]MDW0111855.1 YggS family pyridoxal phosphate-dependent enzyme [Sporosarcina saromensis]
MGKLQERIQHIEREIQAACERSGRNREDITVIAVTKQVSTERTKEVIDLGILHVGENRPEGLLAKRQDIQSSAVCWHYIGNVQSRKVKEVIHDIHCLHSLDRISLAKEIQKRASAPIDCFVQVNVSGEQSKSGVSPDELRAFLQQLATFDKIRVIGLMTMAPFTEDQDVLKSVFSSLRQLRDEMAAANMEHAPCTQLSMGMSNDFAIAIEEGATHVRIGTALVGTESEGEQ